MNSIIINFYYRRCEILYSYQCFSIVIIPTITTPSFTISKTKPPRAFVNSKISTTKNHLLSNQRQKMVSKINIHQSKYIKLYVYHNQYQSSQIFQKSVKCLFLQFKKIIHPILQGIQRCDKLLERHHHHQVNLTSFGTSQHHLHLLQYMYRESS